MKPVKLPRDGDIVFYTPAWFKGYWDLANFKLTRVAIVTHVDVDHKPGDAIRIVVLPVQIGEVRNVSVLACAYHASPGSKGAAGCWSWPEDAT